MRVREKVNDYRRVYTTTPVYRVNYYRVVLYEDPLLEIHGDTKCGLRFILKVDQYKTLSLTTGKNTVQCRSFKPNYIISLKHHNKIDQFTVFTETNELEVCNWYYGVNFSKSEYERDAYAQFQVVPKNSLHHNKLITISKYKNKGLNYVR